MAIATRYPIPTQQTVAECASDLAELAQAHLGSLLHPITQEANCVMVGEWNSTWLPGDGFDPDYLLLIRGGTTADGTLYLDGRCIFGAWRPERPEPVR